MYFISVPLVNSLFLSLSVYASVSLYLMAQKPGTLILYDDVIQVFHGSPSKIKAAKNVIILLVQNNNTYKIIKSYFVC